MSNDNRLDHGIPNFDSKKDCEPTVDPENQNCESEMYTAIKYFLRASYAIICQLPCKSIFKFTLQLRRAIDDCYWRFTTSRSKHRGTTATESLTSSSGVIRQ